MPNPGRGCDRGSGKAAPLWGTGLPVLSETAGAGTTPA